ncbi:MAG: rhodanese-like domain-containing protein [Ghiorsea sp.]|nr:rhodanese-like domain-containing protein [Ghiorsea sp.]
MLKYLMMLMVGLGLLACDNTPPEGSSLATVQEAHEVLLKGQKAEPFLFLDVRTPGEYQGGHVPTAKNIPVQVLAQRLAEVPKDKKVFVYCESGVRSSKATQILVDAGYTNIINMKASMRGWRGAGFKTER